ncbi:MAG TPA: radical SAM protein [Nitrospirae bacterium]|nr:radical SAM protein [Nitrospirota bacterium]
MKNNGRLLVCETFRSIQGESSYAGYPCFFIRLTGCNLRCTYCDTVYAYEGGQETEIEALIDDATGSGLGLVEVTGGEPLLQENAFILISGLADEGFKVLVETNGSRDISKLDKRCVAIIDIKTPGSGMAGRMDFGILKRLRKQDEIKFVITSPDDYVWSKGVIKEYGLKEERVLFSPSTGAVKPEDLAGWMLDDGLSVRLNLQIHKYIFSDRRGV